jgi:hypothetical protein
MTDRRMDIHKAELWFNASVFLGCGPPPMGWAVDWDRIDHTTKICTEACDRERLCDGGCMAGILIKHVDSGRIWRLTGERTRPPDEMYQGRWPD